MFDKPKYGCPITYKNEQALNKEISQHTSFLTLACKVEYLSIDNSAMTNYKTYLRIEVKNESKGLFTAVSTKVVPQKCRSLRDNAD